MAIQFSWPPFSIRGVSVLTPCLSLSLSQLLPMALPPPPPPPSGRRFNRRIHSPGNEKTPQPRPEIRYRHRRREEGRSLVHTKKIAFTIRAKARERKEWEEGGGGGCFGGGGLVPLVLSLFLSVHLFGSRCAVADVCCCCLERGGRATRVGSQSYSAREGRGGRAAPFEFVYT